MELQSDLSDHLLGDGIVMKYTLVVLIRQVVVSRRSYKVRVVVTIMSEQIDKSEVGMTIVVGSRRYLARASKLFNTIGDVYVVSAAG